METTLKFHGISFTLQELLECIELENYSLIITPRGSVVESQCS